MKKTIHDLEARTSEYGNILTDADESGAIVSREHSLLRELRNLLSTKSMRMMRE